MSKRYDDRIEVEWDGSTSIPLGFVWRGRSYRVDQPLQSWREVSWDPAAVAGKGRDVECFRVLAHPAGHTATGDVDPDGSLVSSSGAVYDLTHDLGVTRSWRLVRVWD